MKLEVKKEHDLFGNIIITMQKKGFYISAEVSNEADAEEWIKNNLQKFASELVRKMYSQKEFFFHNGHGKENQLKAFSLLGNCLRSEITLNSIKGNILVLLSELMPQKTASHYELYRTRYDWLFSLVHGTPNNVNARELHNLYIIKQTEKTLLNA